MKLLIFSDNHFCETSSIIRKFGDKYTMRLENQIASINWVEKVAEQTNCEAIICLGDFFNTSTLSDQELTASKDIQWTNKFHYFLVGNHESSINDLKYSSVKALESTTKTIISKPSSFICGDTEFCFLPYIVESDRQELKDYFGDKMKKRVIFSHNDISGIQLGPVVTKSGFTIEEIESNCDLFINGHLHNGTNLTTKVINLGNLTGKDFGEDANKYTHNVMILDTDTLTYELIENPYAFNFYKIEAKEENDLQQLSKLKNNAIISIKCAEKLVESLKSYLNDSQNILEYRLIIIKSDIAASQDEMIDINLSNDYLTKFITCCQEKLGTDPILEQELTEICK